VLTVSHSYYAWPCVAVSGTLEIGATGTDRRGAHVPSLNCRSDTASASSLAPPMRPAAPGGRCGGLFDTVARARQAQAGSLRALAALEDGE